jgi:hypothetical protein
MRRHALRALVLAGALTAFAVPALSMTASANTCPGSPGCTGSSTGVIDTYFSPPVVSVNTAVFSETANAGEVTYYVPGQISLTVNDLTNNNQGFVLSLASSNWTTSLSSTFIPASDFTLNGPAMIDTTSCVYTVGGGCGPVTPVSDTVGVPLSSPAPFAVQCPTEQEGSGLYSITQPLLLTIPVDSPEDLLFGNHDISWYGTFTVSLTQGIDFSTYGCASIAPGGLG